MGRSEQSTGIMQATSSSQEPPLMDRFLRFVLPAILLAILVIVAIFVTNAFEATHMMESEKRAGPTLLNR